MRALILILALSSPVVAQQDDPEPPARFPVFGESAEREAYFAAQQERERQAAETARTEQERNLLLLRQRLEERRAERERDGY